MSDVRLSDKLPDYDEALQRMLTHCPVLGTGAVEFERSLGRVLRQPVVADRDQPPFDRSAMDGFALRSASVKPGASFPVVGEVAAGALAASQTPLLADAAVRIATGAPLPPGADAVIQIEKAVLDESTELHRVSFDLDSCPAFNNVHRRASDAAAGDVVLKPGQRIRPQHIGAAAMFGATRLTVTDPPRVALLTTGDELRDPQTPTDALGPQQIRNSNGPMLNAFFQAMGVDPASRTHISDQAEQTLAAAREALASSHLVVTTGGVSVGRRDWLPWAWKQLGLRTLIHGAAIKPGKPIFIATPSTDQSPDNKLVIGLPGNPVSALMCAHLFVRPLLDKMQIGGESAPGSRTSWRWVKLANEARSTAKRELFRAARFVDDGVVQLIDWRGSGDLVHTADADGLVRLPRREHAVPAGAAVAYLPFSLD